MSTQRYPADNWGIVSREPNRRLAILMAEAAVSNKGLAKRVRDVAQRRGVHVGTTHVAVQRWLDGGGIQAQTVAFLAEALSGKLHRRVTPDELGFPGAAAAVPTVGTSYPGSAAEALNVMNALTQLRPEDGATNARLLPEADTNSAVLDWLVSRPDGLPDHSRASRRIGMRDVAAIRTASHMFMRLDFLYGGGHGHAALRHYFRHEVIPLLNASYSEKVGHALFTAAAEMGEVLAWTAYDIGNHSLANRYLVSALRLTQTTDDRMMGATILANMSHQANYLGNFQRAARLSRAAVEGGKSSSTPRAKAMFAAHEARALASSQDSTGASRAMNEAEKHFEKAATTQDPEWLGYFGQAELIGEFSHCFRDLKRPAESLRFAHRAVDQTAPEYARTLAFCRMVLAESQLLNGDLDAAVATAGMAVEEGKSVQSARFLRYVSDFQKKVAVHAAMPVVARLNEQVTRVLTDLDE